MKKVQVWIVCEDEVLLLKVVPDRGAGWHPITANVEKGEKLSDCAKREVFEETGLTDKKGELLPLDFSFEYDGRWGHAVEHAYVFLLKKKPSKIKIDPSEHTDFEWLSFKEAEKALSFKPQKEALEKVKCILSKI